MGLRTRHLAAALTCLALVALWSSTALAVTTVTANVDPATAEVGKTFDYVLEVASSESGRISFETEPDFGELRLVGRQQRSSFTAGVGASRKFTFIFSLAALETGTFNIGGPTVVVAGERFKLANKRVKVVGRGKAPKPKIDPDSPYAIEVDVTPERDPYVGEQVTVSYRLLRDARSPNAQPTIPDEPALDDFWTEDLTDANGYQRRTVRSGGKVYEEIVIRSYGLFPLKSGPAKIEPMTVELQIGGFFQRSRQVTLRSKERRLNVKPLPPNAPEGFVESNVGKWEFTTRVDHRATKVGRPITLELIAEGEGHAERLALPELDEVDGFRITHRDTEQRSHRTSRVIGGRKVTRISLMPTRAGTLTLPSISFHHFDPEQGAYRTTVSDPIVVKVVDGELPELNRQDKVEARADTEEGDVIAGLTASLEPPLPDPTIEAAPGSPFELWWFWLLAALPALGLLGLLLERPFRTLKAESAPRRERAASAGVALGALEEASSWDELYTALRRFIEVRLNVPGGRITGDEIVDALAERGITEETRERARALLQRIEQARFSGGQSTPGEDDIDETRKLVDALTAEATRPGRSAGLVVALLAGSLAAALLSASPAYAATPSPHDAWEAGDFDVAAKSYERIARQHPTSTAANFNAGTSAARVDDFGKARFYMERAAYLSPWTPEVRSQLETVRRIVRLRSIEASRTGKTLDGDEPLFWWRFGTQIWPPAVALVILLGLWLALVGGMVRRFVERPALRDAAFVALVSGLLLAALGGAAAGIRSASLSSVEAAVWMSDSEVRDGPSQHAKTLDLPSSAIPGTVVRVVERRGDWVKIALPGGLSGWTKNGAISSIAPHDSTL